MSDPAPIEDEEQARQIVATARVFDFVMLVPVPFYWVVAGLVIASDAIRPAFAIGLAIALTVFDLFWIRIIHAGWRRRLVRFVNPLSGVIEVPGAPTRRWMRPR